MLKTINLRKIYRLEEGEVIKDCESKEKEYASSNIGYRAERTSQFFGDFVLNCMDSSKIYGFKLTNDIITINNNGEFENYIVVSLEHKTYYTNFKCQTYTGTDMVKYYITKFDSNITSVYQSIMEYIRHMEIAKTENHYGLESSLEPKYFNFSNVYENEDMMYYIDPKNNKIKPISALPIDITRKIFDEVKYSEYYSHYFIELAEDIYRRNKYKIVR